MTDRVSSLLNIGPATEALFERVGIMTAEDVRSLGADVAYLKLLESGVRPHFMAYYALVMGLQGRPWYDCQGREKSDLKRAFDKLKFKAGANPTRSDKAYPDGLLNALDIIGVRLSPEKK